MFVLKFSGIQAFYIVICKNQGFIKTLTFQAQVEDFLNLFVQLSQILFLGWYHSLGFNSDIFFLNGQ